MVGDYLFELSHYRSQSLITTIQPTAQLGTSRHGLLIRTPSLRQEVDVFHKGFGRTAESVRRLGIESPAWRRLRPSLVLFPHRLTHLASSIPFARLIVRQATDSKNRQNPETITEGAEMSIEVNSRLLTLLVTVLVLPFEMYVISASDFSATSWWPTSLGEDLR
jgi:hypothetical protein